MDRIYDIEDKNQRLILQSFLLVENNSYDFMAIRIKANCIEKYSVTPNMFYLPPRGKTMLKFEYVLTSLKENVGKHKFEFQVLKVKKSYYEGEFSLPELFYNKVDCGDQSPQIFSKDVALSITSKAENQDVKKLVEKIKPGFSGYETGSNFFESRKGNLEDLDVSKESPFVNSKKLINDNKKQLEYLTSEYNELYSRYIQVYRSNNSEFMLAFESN